jgi:uncharacterized protein (DUF2147 family)
MKLLIVLALMSSVVFAATEEAAKVLPVTKAEQTVKNDKKKTKKAVKLDDCDNKIKKKVEITEQSISLGSNTGCSLDDAH